MKKLLLSLMGLALLATSAFAYPEPTMEGSHKVNNTANNQKSSYREIKLVRWNGSQLPVPVSGDALAYDLNSDDGVTVRLTTTSADGGFAGIAVTTCTSVDSIGANFGDDVGRANWLYIVIHGMANANISAGGTNINAAGDAFVTSTDSGKITGVQGVTTAAVLQASMTSLARGAGGIFMDAADGTSTTAEVFVKNE